MTPKLNLDVFDEVVEKPAIDLSAFDKVVEKKSPSESASSSTKPSSAQQSTSSLKELAAPPVSAESKVTTGLEPKSKYDELIEGTLEYRKSEGVNERLIEQDLAEQEEIAYQKQLKDKEERNKANTYISLINRPLSYLTEEQKQEYKEQMKARGIPNSVIESAWYEKERKEVNELGAQNKKQELADIQVEAQELGKKPEELFSERAVQWGVDRLNLEQKKLYDVQRKSEAGEPLTPQEQTLLGEYSQKKLYDQYGNLIDKPSPQDIKDEAEIGAMVVENKKLYKDQLKDIYEDKYSSLKYFDDLMNQVMTTPNGDFTPKELTSAAWAGQRSNPEMKPFIDEAFRVEKQRHAAWKEFEAMKRAYLLNVDPAKTGAGAGGRFTDALLEGTKESPVFGFVNELVDRKHELLSSNQNEKVFEQIANETGLPQTEVQKEKFKDTFYEKAADTFGGSLPVMGEIVLSTMAANYLGGISGVSRLSKLYNYQLGKKYGKGAEFLANLVDNTMKGYVTYAPTQETGATGVGEGSAQQFVDMLNPEKWAGGKYKKFFEYAARVGVGLTGETAQEYSGQFINALVENGADWEEVFAQTFGRTPEDQEDQLLLTMLQSALFSGAFNLGVLKDGLVALKKSTKPEAKQVTNVVEQVIEEREEDAKKPPEEPPASSVEEIKIEEPLAKTEKQAELSKIEEKQNKIKELLTQKPKEDAVQVEETTAGVLRDTGVRGEGELQGVEQQDQPKEPTELREPSEQREKVEEVTAIPEAETEGQPQIQTDETLQEERKGQETLLTETQPTPVSEEVAETEKPLKKSAQDRIEEQRGILFQEYSKAGDDLEAFTKDKRDSSGMIDDATRKSKEYLKLKDRYEVALKNYQDYNKRYKPKRKPIAPKDIAEKAGKAEGKRVTPVKNKGEVIIDESGNLTKELPKRFEQLQKDNDLKGLDELYSTVRILLNGVAQSKGEKAVNQLEDFKKTIEDYAAKLKSTTNEKTKKTETKVLEKPIVKETPETLTKTESKLKQGLPEGTTIIKSSDSDRQVEIKVKKKAKEATDAAEDKGISLKDQKNDLVAKMQSAVAIMKGEEKITPELEKELNEYGIRAIKPSERESELYDRQQEIATKIKQTESAIKEEERHLSKKPKPKDFDAKWEREEKYRDLKAEKRKLEGEYIDFGDKIRSIGENAQLEFQIKGDGTVRVGLEKLADTLEMTKKEFPDTEEPKKKEYGGKSERIGTGGKREPFDAMAGRTPQEAYDIAKENLQQAKGNKELEKIMKERLDYAKQQLEGVKKGQENKTWNEINAEDMAEEVKSLKKRIKESDDDSRVEYWKKELKEKEADLERYERYVKDEKLTADQRIERGKEKLGKILKGKSGKAYDITGLTAELLGAIGELAVAYAEKYGKKGIEQFKKYINETFPNITDAEVTKIYDDATKDVKEPVEEKAEEKGEKKKTILTKRAYEGETREEVKKYLEEKGLTRKVVSQEERSKQAAEFIKEYGEETAIEAVKNFDVRGAQATAILAQVIKRINADMAKLKSTDVEQLDALAKEQAEVTALLEQEGFLAGELVGQLAYEYQDDALGFNVEKLIDDYKKENKGEISPEVEAKFRDLARENAALNEKIKQLESEKEKGQETIDNIRESVEREKKRRPKTSEQIKLATDKIVAKVKQGKIHRPNIFSAATPASLAWDTALDTVALAIKATGRTAEAIAKGLEYIKTTDWYKGLNDDKKQEAEDAYNEFWKVQPTFEVTEKGIKIPHSTIRDFVERGIDNIEDLTKKVHEVIKETNPEVTEREVRDAITGYGKTVNPNQEEVEMQIRKMKRIGRIISALEDVANKKRPLKSGQQRDKLDAQERALNKELREAMKDLPIDEQTEAEHLKTRLDAVKTNLRNRIEDLTKEIESGEKIPENKKPVEYDEEAKLLKAEKERLQAIHDEIFGKPELSDEQRINIATKATKKSIQELERRIAEGDLEAKKKESKTPNTPELEALRKKREDLKAEIKRLQDIANPPLSPEQKRLEQNKKAVQRSIAELERRIREKDFAPKEKKGIILDDELTRLKAEKLRLKEEYDKELYKVKLQNRTTKQKIVDHLWDAWGITRALRATGEFSFVLIQGLINTIAHPLQASQAMKNAIRFMFSPKKTEDWLRNLKSQEFYPMLKESKLAITEPNAEITAREELFYSGWTDMIWNNIGKIFGKNAETWQKLNPFHALERASTGYLDTQRVLRFLDGVEMLQEKGIEFNDNPQAYKDMADVINTFTGRASIGRLDQKLLSKVLFSPRNWASQIKTATPYAFYHFGKMRAGAESFKPSVAQKMAIADFSKFVGLTTTMVALAALSLNDDDDEETSVETDPRSSDFGKIKIGDTRIDPWGGRIQQIVLMSRLISDSIKRSGKVQKLGGNNPNRLELVLEMAANKLNPSASMIERYATTRINKEGERVDKYGKPYSISDDLQLYPIYWETISEILKDDPKALDGLLIFYAFFGGGVNVYETKKEEKPTLRKKVVREPVKEKREPVE